MPSFANGVTYPKTYPDAANETFTASDGTLSATITSVVNTITGDTCVVLVAPLDTGAYSLAKDPAFADADAVSLPTAAGTVNPDTSLTDYVFGTYTMWRRDVSDGKMYTSALTVSQSGLSVSNTLDFPLGKADLYKNLSNSSMSIVHY